MSDDPVSDPAAAASGAGAPGGRSAGTPDPDGGDVQAREAQERDAARRRGEARQHARAAARAAAREAAEAPAPRVERRAFRAAERAFQALSENVRDYAVFLLDADGIITYWGEGARLMKWWTRDEAVGAHLRLLYPDGGAEDGSAEDHLVAAAEHGESVSEGRRVRSDGSVFWAGATLTALRDVDGTLLGFAKVTRDLTARRAADAALVAAAEAERGRAAAEAVSAAKSEFVATMSHEVRTPITAVLGYADLLADGIGGPLTEEQRSYVERLRLSARHLHGLVEAVLDLSRIDADPAPVEQGRRAGGRRRRGRARAGGAAGAPARPGARGGPPDAGGGAFVLGRRGTRAADPREPARQRGEVHPAAGRGAGPGHRERRGGDPARRRRPPPGAGPWVYVRVEDTGPGIRAEQLSAIFDPFMQVGRPGDRGAGLGLTISRRLARGMGGEISVESVVGVGSAFVVWLPEAPLASLRTGGGA
jgi:PAS domain S-box-containing protein